MSYVTQITDPCRLALDGLTVTVVKHYRGYIQVQTQPDERLLWVREWELRS